MRFITGENIRSVVVFSLGIAIIAHQTFLREIDRPFLLGLAATMIGIDLYFRKISRNGGNGSGPKQD
jgi:hypothetical protein